MRKRLAVLVGFALVAAIILVARFDKDYDSPGHSYDIKCIQQNDPSSAAASLACAINPMQNTDQSKSSAPWWHKLLAWPEGITAWLLLFTLGAIFWQSSATAKSADAAFLQIQMMKDKERARVEIKALGLTMQRVGEDFWHIMATIELRNVGLGRAYVRLGAGNLEVSGDDMPTEPYSKSLDIVDGFIDPTGDPATESFYFFQPENAVLSEYAQKICDGEIGVYIVGFIEYETVGTRFHRDFNYAWVGHGSPLNIGARLTVSDEFAPKSDEDRVSFGFWSPNSIWMTGRSGDNDEYEMEPPKKTKNPHKAN
jgi:hypothetical protein